jgi:two-component system CheB/CheR fusion protein
MRDSEKTREQLIAELEDAHSRIASLEAGEAGSSPADPKLADSQALLSAIIGGTTDSVFVKDPAGRYVLINSAGAEVCGKPILDILGRDDTQIFSPESAREIMERDRRIMESRETVTVDEIGLITASGRRAAFLSTKGPILDRDGNVLGVFGITKDVTEARKTQEALRESKERAEAATRAKSEFLANMSHEVRTPLNGVLGMLQLLATTHLDQEQSEYVRTAEQASQRLAQLLSDILDLSKVESGTLTLRDVAFGLDDVREGVLALFAPAAREKGITLDFRIAPGLPVRLMGDEVRLRQILINLVGNAIKFTDAGGVLVLAEPASGEDASSVAVRITVSDTGCGIPDSQLTRIFDPFVQADGSYVRRAGGAGLGLAIVKRLADMMGGDIDVTSCPRSGTSMSVTLPFGLPGKGPRPMPRPGRTCADPRSLRVLLVEDDRTNQLTIRRMLEKAGHGVETADNGRQALDRIASGGFDCVFMDVEMPVLDGVEATRIIRSEPRYEQAARIPIVALTAHAMAGDREKFLAAGMDDYLSKPVSMQDLKRILDWLACPPGRPKGGPRARAGQGKETAETEQIGR